MEGDLESRRESVKVEVLGAVRARVDGFVLEGSRLGSLKTRQLILALSIESPRRLTTEQLVDRLWTSPPEGAERTVTGLVSRARRALGREGVEGNARSGYRMASEVDVDLRHAEEALARLVAAQARGRSLEILTLAQDASAILSKGIPAADDRSGFEWIEELRRHVDRCLVRARSAGARAALANANCRLAIELAQEVRRADPFDEEAVALLMRAHSQSGDFGEAIRTFTRYEAELLDEVGGSPGAELVALVERMRPTIEPHGARLAGDIDSGDDETLQEVVLGAAAVVGRTFDADRVGALCSLDPVKIHVLLGHHRRDGLIVEDGASYRFSDDQRRKELLGGIPSPLRRSLHRRAAELCGCDPASAAEHLEAADEWSSALEEWRRAAVDAKAAFALTDAETLLGHAITVADRHSDVADQARYRIERGRVREQLGRYDSALEDHRHAVELARDVGLLDLENTALERAAWTLYYARNTTSAEDLRDRALPWCEQLCRSPNASTTTRVLLGRLRHATGDLGGADAVLDTFEQEGSDSANQVSAGVAIALLHAHHDRYADAYATAERTARAARQSGQYRDVMTSTLVSAVVSVNTGWLATALDRVELIASLSTEFDDPSYRVRALTMKAVVWLELGDLRHATELAKRAISLAREVGGDNTHSGMHARLVHAEASLRLTGRLDRVLVDPIPGEVSYARRLELRRLELRARLDREFAKELLERATADRAPKYQALGYQHLDCPDEALDVAANVGSDLLLTKVGLQDQRRVAQRRVAARLPMALRRVYDSEVSSRAASLSSTQRLVPFGPLTTPTRRI